MPKPNDKDTGWRRMYREEMSHLYLRIIAWIDSRAFFPNPDNTSPYLSLPHQLTSTSEKSIRAENRRELAREKTAPRPTNCCQAVPQQGTANWSPIRMEFENNFFSLIWVAVFMRKSSFDQESTVPRAFAIALSIPLSYSSPQEYIYIIYIPRT